MTRIAIVLAGLVLAAGCGGDDADEAATVAGTVSVPAETETAGTVTVDTSEVNTESCESAADLLLAPIEAELDEGMSLNNAHIVTGSGQEGTVYISAQVEGPGAENQVATWVATSSTGDGIVYSADATAKKVSDFEDAAEAGVDVDQTAVDASRDCVGR